MISGFILGLPFARHVLANGPPVVLKQYFLRRLSRLEPPYIVAMITLFIASVVMGIVGAFADGTARPMVVAFAACAVLAFAITQLTLGGRSRQVSQVPAE